MPGTGAEEIRCLGGCSIIAGRIVVDDHTIKMPAEHPSLFDKIRRPAFATCRVNGNTPRRRMQSQRSNHRFQGVGIVTIIDDDQGLAECETLKPPRQPSTITRKGFQPIPDLLKGQSKMPGGPDGGQDIRGLKWSFPSHRQWDLLQPGQWCFDAAASNNNLTPLHEHTTPTGFHVRNQDFMFGIKTEKRHPSCAQLSHRGRLGVLGIQHSHAGWQNHIDSTPLDGEHLLGSVDIGLSQVVTSPEICHYGHVTSIEPQPLPKNPPDIGYRNDPEAPWKLFADWALCGGPVRPPSPDRET